MQRVVVIGSTGSGKSTLAQQVAPRISADIIDADALFWQADWQETPPLVFRERIEQAVSGDAWIFAGNYGSVRDLVWPRADTLIWLNYPLPLVFGRLLRRTVQRIVTQEDLWGSGNHETWRKQFLTRESLFLWLFKTHRRRQHEIPHLLRLPENAHLTVIQFNSPRATDHWLAALPTDAL